MSKDSFSRKPLRAFFPEELPFEEGTGLSRQDPCSRLVFQLILERVLSNNDLEVSEFDFEVSYVDGD